MRRRASRPAGVCTRRRRPQQLGMFADCTNTGTMRANQLWLWIASMAYTIVHELRRVGLAGTSLARAQVGTIRTRLLKIAGRVKLSVRRVRVALSSLFSLQAVFERALLNLRGA